MRLSLTEVDNRTAQLDLILSLWQDGDRLSGYVHYDTDLFHEATMARLVGHYRTLLDSVMRDPAGRGLDAAPAERRRVAAGDCRLERDGTAA